MLTPPLVTPTVIEYVNPGLRAKGDSTSTFVLHCINVSNKRELTGDGREASKTGALFVELVRAVSDQENTTLGPAGDARAEMTMPSQDPTVSLPNNSILTATGVVNATGTRPNTSELWTYEVNGPGSNRMYPPVRFAPAPRVTNITEFGPADDERKAQVAPEPRVTVEVLGEEHRLTEEFVSTVNTEEQVNGSAAPVVGPLNVRTNDAPSLLTTAERRVVASWPWLLITVTDTFGRGGGGHCP